MLNELNANDILGLIKSANFTPKIPIIVKESIPSTNDYLMDMLKSKKKLLANTLVIAKTQTAGKGRLGRVWVSPPGNVYMSLYWPFATTLDKLYGLSLVVGIALARVLDQNGLTEVKVKWPNDIYWHNHKIGGILIETLSDKDKIDSVIGIGLNVCSMDLSYSAQIMQKHVSLESALQKKISVNKIIAQIVVELKTVLETFSNSGFDVFIQEYKKLSLT